MDPEMFVNEVLERLRGRRKRTEVILDAPGVRALPGTAGQTALPEVGEPFGEEVTS